MIYIKEVREALHKINYCEGNAENGGKCTLSNLCEECQGQLWEVMLWSDPMSDRPENSSEDEAQA